MTLTRPRLMAISLCALLTLIVLWFAWSSNRAGQSVREARPLSVMMEPSPPMNFAPADPSPVRPPSIDAGNAGREAGPNIGPTAAPGVAFNYRYAFRLGAARIAEVQERHAAMCERLTVARCRITGMLYRVVGERDIEAMLALKVDPAGARHFGREATDVVVQAEGLLTESEISGTDAGAAIEAAGRGIAGLEAELARLEARLRRGTAAERGSLDYEAQLLRERIRALRDGREASQESLAVTPMMFRYGSGDRVPGFAPRPTLGQSLEDAGQSFVSGAELLLRLVIALLPWALAAGLIAWIAARIRRRWFAPAAAPADK
ncbi:MAG: hypothetical protein QOJ53_1179 [Sphingomonadales bacterium]|jgi:hypothetical protein|nr:hypothetical protein [Sphingomonadales bacterium]